MENSITKVEPAGIRSKKRVFYLDVLRVVACLLVIIIHSCSKFVREDFGSFDFWVGNILNSLAREGVPLFVMISGAAFLDENYKFSTEKLVRHIKRMVIFFAFWTVVYSFVYNFLFPIIKHEAISIREILSGVIFGHVHLWFCFMIVGLYLLIPLLRLWVKKENVKQVRYFIILSLIFSMLLPNIINFMAQLFPIFDTLNSILDNLNLQYVGGYTVYFVLGWYLNNYEIKHKKALAVLGIIGILVTIFGTAFLSIRLNEAHQIYEDLSVHVALPSIMVFVFIKNKFINYTAENNKFNKAVSFVSKNSLGVYAIHIGLITVIRYLLKLVGITNAILCIPLLVISSFVIALAASFIMSKIPLLKKVV